MIFSASAGTAYTLPGLFDRERIVARPGFNRWLVPPAALAIHLCIGMAYGFSVFWLPLSQAIGITAPVACGEQIATLAAAFVGLLSLFNIAGRVFWASLSDRIGRKATYVAIFVIGIVLYGSAPAFAHAGYLFLFVAAFCVILSMYGGGFATVPAFLTDLFGTQMVGAIHGRLLTAWSTAGIIGPVVVNYIREAQIGAGVPRALVYDRTLYILAGMLVLGLICNLLVRPVAAKWFMDPVEFVPTAAQDAENDEGIGVGRLTLTAILAWVGMGIPIAWGVWITLSKSLLLFS